MKIIHKPRNISYRNEIKIITKFLWWPIRINNETRWLESASIKCRYTTKLDFLGFRELTWVPIEFVDRGITITKK